MEYHVDHDGTGPHWRVWWIGPDGATRERLFGTASEAQDWIDFMEALEVSAP